MANDRVAVLPAESRIIPLSIAPPIARLFGTVVVASQVAPAALVTVVGRCVPSRVSSMPAIPLVSSERIQVIVLEGRSTLGSPMNAGGVWSVENCKLLAAEPPALAAPSTTRCGPSNICESPLIVNPPVRVAPHTKTSWQPSLSNPTGVALSS